ncbi:CueP family metal-binding protein [Pseudogracilibacillus sp. SO10305]
MKKVLFSVALMSVLFLAACGGGNNENEATGSLSKEELKALVNDYSVGNVEGHQASITSEQLIITDENEEEIVHDLPEDEFFVSIAPFFNETHPCKDHSLTGCQGELVDQEFNILIKDKDGKTVVEEMMNSEANGFVDLWLPRDETFDISIEAEEEGRKVVAEISTFKEDGTCITTLQLL